MIPAQSSEPGSVKYVTHSTTQRFAQRRIDCHTNEYRHPWFMSEQGEVRTHRNHETTDKHVVWMTAGKTLFLEPWNDGQLTTQVTLRVTVAGAQV